MSVSYKESDYPFKRSLSDSYQVPTCKESSSLLPFTTTGSPPPKMPPFPFNSSIALKRAPFLSISFILSSLKPFIHFMARSRFIPIILCFLLLSLSILFRVSLNRIGGYLTSNVEYVLGSSSSSLPTTGEEQPRGIQVNPEKVPTPPSTVLPEASPLFYLTSPSRIAHLRMNIQRIPPLRKTRFQRRIYPLLPPSQPLSTQHNRPPHYGHGIRGIQSRALPTTTFTVTHVTLTRLPAMANSSSGKTTDSSTTWDRLPHQRLRTRPPFPRPSTSP